MSDLNLTGLAAAPCWRPLDLCRESESSRMHSDRYKAAARRLQQGAAPAGCFASPRHRQALACLTNDWAQGEGFVVMTGAAVSAGSTIVGDAIATIDHSRTVLAQAAGAQFAGGGTIPVVAQAFGFSGDPGDPFLLDNLLCFLRDERQAGRRCLLVVDQADAVPTVALESLRLLTDFRVGARSLLQILLLGTSRFRERLQSCGDLEQLRQRVVAWHDLDVAEPVMTDWDDAGLSGIW